MQQSKRGRGRPTSNAKTERMFFVLDEDLKNGIREVAQANYVSESQFVRDSIRKNIMLYKKALLQEKGE